MIENYWLKQAQLITWEKKPNKELRVKKNNHYEYFPDGKLNLYENLIENNLLNGLGNKTAIITVDKEKNIQKYTYNEIDQKVNFFSNFLLNKIPKNRISKTRIMIYIITITRKFLSNILIFKNYFYWFKKRYCECL